MFTTEVRSCLPLAFPQLPDVINFLAIPTSHLSEASQGVLAKETEAWTKVTVWNEQGSDVMGIRISPDLITYDINIRAAILSRKC